MNDIPERYRSKTPMQAVAHLGEELSEAATACCKTLRWGLESVNPELPFEERETNLAWVRREMRDVVRAYRELDRLLSEAELTEPKELISDLRAREAQKEEVA